MWLFKQLLVLNCDWVMLYGYTMTLQRGTSVSTINEITLKMILKGFKQDKAREREREREREI